MALTTSPRPADAVLSSAVDADEQRTRLRDAVVSVLLAFAVTRLVILVVIYFSSLVVPAAGGSTPAAGHHNLLLGGLIHWDAGIYLQIAAHGYQPSTHQGVAAITAFFPGYPLLVHLVEILVRSADLAGVLVANLSFLVALTYLYLMVRRLAGHEAGARAVFYLAAAPAAVFFSAAYSEGLFLACVAATFYHADRGQWLPAAMAAAIGSATRNTGALLAVVIALEALRLASVTVRPLRSRVAEAPVFRDALVRAWPGLLSALCGLTGLAAYMLYLGHTYGDPLAFVHAQRYWEHNNAAGQVPGIVGAAGSHAGGLLSGAGQHTGVVLINALVVLGFAPLVLAVALTMRPAYGVYTILTFAVPIALGHGVISMIRYVLMLLPCIMLLAVWGRRPWVDRLVLALSLPLMAYLAVTYSHNYQPV